MPGRLVSTPLGNMMAYDRGTQDMPPWWQLLLTGLNTDSDVPTVEIGRAHV